VAQLQPHLGQLAIGNSDSNPELDSKKAKRTLTCDRLLFEVSMTDAIRLVLSHIPIIMFLAAIVVALIVKKPEVFSARLLAWLLLLSVGVEETWAGLFHVFDPHLAASSIGWEVSPFQFEIGVADIAIGVTAMVSFWRNDAFKAATICYVVLFYAGVAIGHVREAVLSHDFSGNNFGTLLLITVIKVFLLPALYLRAQRSGASAH
jgi:hypothetical protein